MKILITGASGFLGGRIVERLNEEGHEVVVIGRSAPRQEHKPIFTQADINDKASLEACKNKHPNIDCVIHMAALVPKNKDEDQPEPMLQVNVQGTINILEVFGKDLQNFVYASTAEVYGLPDANEPLAEDVVLPRPLSYYGASKLAGEKFCQVYAAKHGLSVSILRYTVLYGPGDKINRAIPNFIKKALNGDDLKVFGGEELRDYLHVYDAAEATCIVATKRVEGVLNIGTGEGISIKETAEQVAQLIDESGEISVLPREKKAADIVLNIDKLQRLGFTPKYKFPELLEEQIAWHKNN